MNEMSQLQTLAHAQALDEKDPLRSYATEFYKNNGITYVDGNSLGLCSKRAEQAVLSVFAMWKQHGIDGWGEGTYPWFTLSERIGQALASLVGAHPDEVIATGSTTSNLHQLLATFYRPEGKRTKIVTDALNFPTDFYAIKSHLRLHHDDEQTHLRVVESLDGHTLCEDDIIAAMDEEVAVVLLSSVLYRSAQRLSLKKLTDAAHSRGIIIGFDLCHSIGSIPHTLSADGVDFAVWCTYKHLNGGPGSVAGLYVHRRHHDRMPGLAGWFGSNKEKQFDMSPTFTQGDGAGAFQMGTPHLLSLAPLIGALELFAEVGLEAVREKSLKLTDYFLALLAAFPETQVFTVRTPIAHEQRGGHIYLEHKEAARICKALKQAGVIPDYRAPSGIRIAPVALYNSFTDVYTVAITLRQIMKDKTYERFSNTREVIA
ncbi:kynureninase [Bacillus sp. FSL W7-1360]